MIFVKYQFILMTDKNENLLSIVVSVYNEEKNLKAFFNELLNKTENINKEIIFVNDGSYDNSYKVLSDIKSTNTNVKIINLSRNFGHEAAMLAGIDNAKSEYILCLDADLQHPPEIIPEMLEKAKNGSDIVFAKRKRREDGGFIKKILSKLFYKLINKMSPVRFEPDASDFFLISKRIQLILINEFRERNRFLRGFIQSIGFKTATVDFIATKRFAGESNYSLLSLMKLSISAIVAFSKQPLYIGLYLGAIFGIFSLVVGIYSIIMKFIGTTPPGYTTLVVIISLLFSIQFFIIGIIGLYIGFLFEEQKKRPIYIIDKII